MLESKLHFEWRCPLHQLAHSPEGSLQCVHHNLIVCQLHTWTGSRRRFVCFQRLSMYSCITYMLMWAHVCALIECAGPSTKYIQSYYNFVILSMNLNIYRYIYGGWYACNIRIHLTIPIKLNIWTLFYVVRSVSTKRLIVGAKKAAKIPLLLTRGTWKLLIELMLVVIQTLPYSCWRWISME